ncbi:MAG: PilZ domain-containing protein [Treponema sp.]|nr:PilZ domain-containing protein [Treponema sp.]
MAILTSQQISKYYDAFRAIDVTFTKEVIKSTALLPQQVCLKCVGEQWPCVIYSTSFSGAKILASAKSALVERIKKANNMVSLRFSFKISDKADPRAFFVAGKVTGFAPYAQSNGDLQFIHIQYTQRPPDDLIEILGRLLEANVNSARRRDERILLTADSMRRICLQSKDTFIFIQGVPRKCIVRDLSFGGAKVILVGLAKFLVGKECLLRLDFDEPRESLDIKGTVVRYEDVEGRKDLAAVAIQFDGQHIPMNFKIHINDYIMQTRGPRGEGGEEASRGDPATKGGDADGT